MIKTRVFVKLMGLLGVGGMLLQGACLTDNFWAEKWSEIVNGSIIAVLNGILGATTGGIPGGPIQI